MKWKLAKMMSWGVFFVLGVVISDFDVLHSLFSKFVEILETLVCFVRVFIIV